jgi:hypothetical protein
LPEGKRGFVLLPRRWVVERSFAWATLPSAGQKLRAICIAFVGYMLKHAADLMKGA